MADLSGGGGDGDAKTYKGNDIDSDADGSVNDAENLAGNSPGHYLDHPNFTNVGSNDHHSRPSAGVGLTETGGAFDSELGWVYEGTTTLNKTGSFQTISLSQSYDDVRLHFRNLLNGDGSGNYTTVNMQVNGVTDGYYYRYSDGATGTSSGSWPLADPRSGFPFAGETRVSGGDTVSVGSAYETYTSAIEGGECYNASGQVSQVSLGSSISGYTITGEVEIFGRMKR